MLTGPGRAIVSSAADDNFYKCAAWFSKAAQVETQEASLDEESTLYVHHVLSQQASSPEGSARNGPALLMPACAHWWPHSDSLVLAFYPIMETHSSLFVASIGATLKLLNLRPFPLLPGTSLASSTAITPHLQVN